MERFDPRIYEEWVIRLTSSSVPSFLGSLVYCGIYCDDAWKVREGEREGEE
jgi:hypothetical protein